MAAIGKIRAARNSRTQIAGANLTMSSWKTTERGDDLDTTNFESQGFDQGTIGVVAIDWSCGGDWDSSQNRQDDPPGLYARDDLGAVKFFENVADNLFFLSNSNRVISAENGADVRDKVKFSANGKTQGSGWSHPTGSV